MKQYQELLKKIVQNGVEKESGRDNMPNTIGLSNAVIKMDMKDGFPLLTTKKMYYKGIIHELLWFLRGDTNIKYLVDNNVNIWNQDAYRWYLKKCNEVGNTITLSFENFISYIKNSTSKEELIRDSFNNSNKPDHNLFSNDYILGDLGKVYGYQWRNQNGVDQIKECLTSLQNNPYSRYHIIDSWNKSDFNNMALPPCHLLYQFIIRPLSSFGRKILLSKTEEFSEISFEMIEEDPSGDILEICDELNIPKFYLDLNMYQRSCDTFLGVPFNLASMSLLLHIFAKATNMVAGVSTWIGGDVHIYKDHLTQIQEQLKREPLELCNIEILKDLKSIEDIENLTIDDFKIIGYNSHETIKGELFTGLKND